MADKTVSKEDVIDEIMRMNSSVPEGQSGEWRVERFVVDSGGAARHNVSEYLNGRDRVIKPGIYTKLMHNDDIVMSDTPAEKGDAREFIQQAKGQVLINGLGLGWTVEACLQKPEVQYVTVIEISKDVIELVAEYLLDKYPGKITIIHADALKYTPPKGKKFDAVWHDIWDGICSDNWKTMTTLHRKYGKRAKWQSSWARNPVKKKRRWESKHPRLRRTVIDVSEILENAE